MTDDETARAISVAPLVALAVIQGTIGITALYGFSALLPAFEDDPAVGPGAAGWVPWVAQVGLLAGFLGWQLMPRAGDPRTSAWLMALLAAALAVGSIAPTVGWIASTATALVAILLWNGGGWAAITKLAVLAAVLGVIAATVTVGVALRMPAGRARPRHRAGGRIARHRAPASHVRRQLAIGLSSGMLQSATIVLLQLAPGIAASHGPGGGAPMWVAPIGLGLPLVASLLAGWGDVLGGRRIILATAVATLVGTILLAVGGALAAGGVTVIAAITVLVGALAVPAGIRHGELVVVHGTRHAAGDQQLRRGAMLRALLVVGIYIPVLVSGLLAASLGWPWVFAAYAVVLALCLRTLAIHVEKDRPAAPVPPRRFVAELASMLKDGRLLWAAAGVLLARAVVFGFLAGMPIVLDRQGYTPAVIAGIASAALLASPLVAAPPARTNRGFGVIAGVVAVLATIMLAAAQLTGQTDASAFDRHVLVYIAAVAAASALIELSKHWSQLVVMDQARSGGSEEHYYRRQAIAGLGGNLGAILGVWAATLSAQAGAGQWIAVLAALAGCAWLVQAAWYLTGPRGQRPRRGRHRLGRRVTARPIVDPVS